VLALSNADVGLIIGN